MQITDTKHEEEILMGITQADRHRQWGKDARLADNVMWCTVSSPALYCFVCADGDR